jgi:saccharopine dehydrogenase-like NADP-dependent oxidoreductase
MYLCALNLKTEQMTLSQNIVVAGAGGIGKAVSLLLANYPEFRGDIYIGDRNLSSAQEAALWVQEGLGLPIDISAFELAAEQTDAMQQVFGRCSLLLDCLPGKEAPRMARIAIEHRMHYVNLTEYVRETNEIMALAHTAETGFVLQSGLAPGFVNILATKLYRDFQALYQTHHVEYIGMRVGGLTSYASSPHFYGFTWSPIGVATEYVEPCVVVRDHKIISTPALSARETLILDGVAYEADLTSGGAADIPDAYAVNARNIDYKTIRYPGHFAWVESVVTNLNGDSNLPAALQREMMKVVPAVEDDIIVIYAFVTGFDKQGVLHRIESAYKVYPRNINGKKLRAIQLTTAAPMAECARLLLEGKWKGIVLQSQIDPDAFMSGPFVESIYNKTAFLSAVAAN